VNTTPNQKALISVKNLSTLHASTRLREARTTPSIDNYERKTRQAIELARKRNQNYRERDLCGSNEVSLHAQHCGFARQCPLVFVVNEVLAISGNDPENEIRNHSRDILSSQIDSHQLDIAFEQRGGSSYRSRHKNLSLRERTKSERTQLTNQARAV